MKIIGALDIVYTLLEILCYVFIYSFVYKHNSRMLKDSIISVETFKMRQRQSAISVSGQMYILLVKIVNIIIMNIALVMSGNNVDVLEIANCLRVFQFGIVSIVQVVSTSELRRKLLQFMMEHIE
jgi:hypothetical protein